jgi:hypothetical protein
MVQTRNSSAIFWIKLIHSLVFLVESAAILYILYSGLFNVGGTALVIAVILVVGEIVIYVANGTVCPLTKLAQHLGDETGHDFIAQFFLPKPFVRVVPMTCGALAIIGLLLVGWRLLAA